jgi:hypothetical protein
MDAGRRARADSDSPGNALRVARQVKQRVFDHGIDSTNVLQQRAAGGRRLDAFTDAFDEAQVQPLLQQANVQAHGWLSQTEALRRSGKASVMDNMGEGVKVVEVEPLHGKVLLMLRMTNHSFVLGWQRVIIAHLLLS